jgi:hypothetical protein
VKAGIGVIILTAILSAPAMLPGQMGAPDSGQLVPDMHTPPDRPERPLVPATAANPRFPLQVQIVSGRWKYNGNHEYKGSGSMRLVGQASQSLTYKYRCADSFKDSGQTYAARWVKQGQKLEILMSKPNSHRTTACRLSTRG